MSEANRAGESGQLDPLQAAGGPVRPAAAVNLLTVRLEQLLRMPR